MGTKKCTEQTFELKYTGYLTDSANVFLHYGYNEWDEVAECKMKKLKSCYKTEVTLPCGAELNFCFRNGNDEWDNNYGNDYSFVPGMEIGYAYVEISNKTEKATVTKVKAATEAKTTKAKAPTKKVAAKKVK